MRAVADVSAVADPNTGVAVYDSTAFQGCRAGSSSAAPASPRRSSRRVYASGRQRGQHRQQLPYTHAGSLFDVTSGSNGMLPPSQLCTARAGWDGPTGLGTPNGTGAF